MLLVVLPINEMEEFNELCEEFIRETDGNTRLWLSSFSSSNPSSIHRVSSLLLFPPLDIDDGLLLRTERVALLDTFFFVQSTPTFVLILVTIPACWIAIWGDDDDFRFRF